MPQSITPAILNAADQLENDLEALDVSARTLLQLLRAGQSTGDGPAPEPTWAITSQGVGLTNNLTQRLGWQISSSTDRTVVALRVWDVTSTENVRVHRVSDGVLMAEANVAGSAGAWASGEVTPFTMVAGVAYRVSARAGGASRTIRYDQGSLVLLSGISKSGNYFGTTDAMPTSSAGQTYTFMDVGFE